MYALLARTRDALEKRRAVRELQRMPKEGLFDLGIRRDQIRDYVHGRGAFAARPAARTAEIIPFPAGRMVRRAA
ncbi:MAG: hypothetical protein CMH12_04995 [Maritimibacter sp.]|nr:hypothetical protein [Maritimibacter sp.]